MKDNHAFLVLGIVGVAAHTVLKFLQLRKDAKTANHVLTLREFIADQWPMTALACLAVLGWFLTYGETMAKYPKLTGWTRNSFFFMGFVGSYLLQKLNDKTKKKINDIVDEKTNKADGLTPKD